MDQDLITLADVPELAGGTGGVRARIPVARLGEFKDRRYGTFSIGRDDYDGWTKNLREVFNGEVPVDYDHGPEKGKSSEAAAWIRGLELDGDKVMASVDFTPQGAQAVRDGRWRYISPTFKADYVDETGTARGRALIGAGLTNRPFLKRGMPAISLSADDFQEPAEAVSDSRGTMDLTKIAKALTLSEDADEATILDRLDGCVILDKGEHTRLVESANAGETAKAERDQERYDAAWTKALDGGRVAPAMKDNFDAMRAKDVDLAVKVLDDLQPIVPTRARGAGAAPGSQPAGEAPEGVDQDRYELHEQATAAVEAAGKTLDSAEGMALYRSTIHTLAEEAE